METLPKVGSGEDRFMIYGIIYPLTTFHIYVYIQIYAWYSNVEISYNFDHSHVTQRNEMSMPKHVSDLKSCRWPHISSLFVQVCFRELTFWAFHPETDILVYYPKFGVCVFKRAQNLSKYPTLFFCLYIYIYTDLLYIDILEKHHCMQHSKAKIAESGGPHSMPCFGAGRSGSMPSIPTVRSPAGEDFRSGESASKV